ncbi:3-deoxy-8-phosphooctulonate synthase [Formicincola oecophyllae]|uniref:2-dehydro-3-deoxyphosphooctonate aldolase n=1 Tax=Formicincola oecophyllae TaxID=2558361 RepID=A0A4Y6U9U4_9PROT|nr:3-deoxy-8-phosphooctulonate synthase [Formicincola oecophyllae]QDH13984.1 3-deoxy-8-phosphooctulonate synthase [Formicincola oecophyllae]
MANQASTSRTVTLGTGAAALAVSQDRPFILVAGPCQIESRAHSLEMAEALKELCGKLGLGLVFKSSFDKANRTSLASQRGVGIEKGLEILAEVRESLSLPVLTDVHDVQQCALAGQVADVLQIPAFLCRQTDLLLAAGATGRAVNIKKGQFLAPGAMEHAAAKVASTGNQSVMLCERGTFFGYGQLVNDMRALPIMAASGWPVMYDATHSVQQPGHGAETMGQRSFVPPLARAAVAAGISALFLETHENPTSAPSDGPVMVPLAALPNLLEPLVALDKLVKSPAFKNQMALCQEGLSL